ncbi:hypothetical protein GCM10027174_33630 [Salinifilum aidingensis]
MKGGSKVAKGASSVLRGVPRAGTAMTLTSEAIDCGTGTDTAGEAAVDAGASLGGAAAGAAVGSAICPGVGTVVGGAVGSMAGDFLATEAENFLTGE